MMDFLILVVFPFFFSALIVILITLIAEKYGTLIGGILGTLPTIIIVAFIFIAINKDVHFASESAAIVPAELGINLIFLLVFIFLVHRSTILAFTTSFIVWGICSTLLYFSDITSIIYTVCIYIVIFSITFTYLEKGLKVPSIGSVVVHYTWSKILMRGVMAGIFISISVILSNINATIAGIFSVFPAVFSSTMVIFIKEHGPHYAAAMGKSMTFGVASVAVYAVSIHFLYPTVGIGIGTIIGFIFSLCATMVLYSFRDRLL